MSTLAAAPVATVTVARYFFMMGICAYATPVSAAEQDVDLVDGGELLDCRNALVALALVDDDELELFAQDSARPVHLVNGELRRLRDLHPAHVSQGPVRPQLITFCPKRKPRAA